MKTRRISRPATALAAALLALITLACVPTRAASRATSLPPTASEKAQFRAIMSRLGASLKDRKAASVSDVLRSLNGEVVKSFEAPKGSRYARVTIRIRTSHVHWDPAAGTESGLSSAGGTVGWYTWKWTMETLPTPRGRDLTITADNTLMLDPVYTGANERDGLGRLLNEALLYHELLHGELLIDAIDTPEWRENLCRTGEFDADARDAGHTVIRSLERDFLLRRAARNAFRIDPPRDGNGASGASFTVVAGRLPDDYQGGVSAQYQILNGGNVRNLRLDLPESGPHRGEVLIRGELEDPRNAGCFIAVLEYPGAPRERGAKAETVRSRDSQPRNAGGSRQPA